MRDTNLKINLTNLHLSWKHKNIDENLAGMKSFTPSLPPCSSCRKFHEPQCGRPHCFVWLWRPPPQTCCQEKVHTDSEARGPPTESPPLTTVFCSVFLGNLLPQFGFDPTHLGGERTILQPRMEWLQASRIYFQVIWRSKSIIFPLEAWLRTVGLATWNQSE